MIRVEGGRIKIAGAVTLKNVTSVLSQGLDYVRSGASMVDLAEVSELDSSLLAALLALVREAHLANRPLAFASLPPELRTLAQLYGVEELLPVA